MAPFAFLRIKVSTLFWVLRRYLEKIRRIKMEKKFTYLPVLFLVIAMFACTLSPITPTATQTLPPTPTEIPSDTPVVVPSSTPSPTPAGPCQIIQASGNVIAYTRPSLQADPFGQVSLAGFPIPVLAKTEDGWLGFDPGVAQAANTGVFRFRWVSEDQVQLTGDCQAVPVVVGPSPGICFTMPMEDTPVYAEPDPSSSLVATLVVDQYAAVLGKNGQGWAKLDLGLGNSGVNQTGWISAESLNFNGPCDSLPNLP
jgi:hypothetical protein